MDVTFPDGFYFGSSTSACQSEGAHANSQKAPDIWDLWYEKEPYKFFGGVGPQDTSRFFENWEEDLYFLCQTGHNAFRTSIAWSRLLPNPLGDPSAEAVAFYRQVFEGVKARGISLFINLFHFDMPCVLQEQGGWESREVVSLYERYARICFDLFGDVVDGWFTFNEPIVHVTCGYLYGYHWPCKVDPKACVQVAYHTALASALAIQTHRQMKLSSKIGIILNLTPAYPRSEHPADVLAAKRAELFENKSFLDPSVKGFWDSELIELIAKHDLLPQTTLEDLEVIKNNTVDFLGVNYYQPSRVCARASVPNPEAPFMPEYYFDHWSMPGRRMNPYRGWEIYPQGLYDIAVNIRDNYANIEWMVTENGMGVENEERFLNANGQIEDTYRIEFMQEHLEALAKGIEAGSNCKGYLVWTFIDCWSWLNAYKNRYGLVSYNLQTGEKTIKKSGEWFKALSEHNGFNW